MTSERTDLLMKLFSTRFWGRVKYTHYRDLPRDATSRPLQNQLNKPHVTPFTRRYLAPGRLYSPASRRTGLPSTSAESRRPISRSWGARAFMAFRPGGEGPGAAAPDWARGGRCSQPTTRGTPRRLLTAAGPAPAPAIYGRPHPASTGYIHRAPALRPKMVPQTSPAAPRRAWPAPPRRRRPSPRWGQRPRHRPPRAGPRRRFRPRARRGGRPRGTSAAEGTERPGPGTGAAHPRRLSPGTATPQSPFRPPTPPLRSARTAAVPCRRSVPRNSKCPPHTCHGFYRHFQTDRSDHLP